MSAILLMIYLLSFIIFALVAFAVMQIKLAGMKVKDFWGFIDANQMLDKLYKFAKQYEHMSPQEQIIYLAEAEKIFNASSAITQTELDTQIHDTNFMIDKLSGVLTNYLSNE